MTLADDRKDDLAPAQQKLEWVTPQISLMEAENTEGSKYTPDAPEINTTVGIS